MKALKLLKQGRDYYLRIAMDNSMTEEYDEAIEELEVLQNENKSLVKTLEKYNEEMIELRKCNQDLLNTIIEAQKSIKNIWRK